MIATWIWTLSLSTLGVNIAFQYRLSPALRNQVSLDVSGGPRKQVGSEVVSMVSGKLG